VRFARSSNSGFPATCATWGAIAIGITGFDLTKGAINSIVALTCVAPTFHLGPGEEFFVWARLYVLHAVTGYTDASNTLSVRLSPDLTPTELQTFPENVVLAPPLVQLGAAPEPATWAMMILGFGLVGTTLRQGRGRSFR
jgi:hypothetical protein